MRRIPLLVAGALAASVSPAIAQDTPAKDAGAVVENAVGALRELTAVSYRIRLSAGGAIADQAPTIEGELLLQERPGADIPLLFRGQGAILPPGGAETQPFLSSFDGESAYGVDFDEKKLYTSEVSAGGLDLLSGTLELIIDAFVVDEPLADERDAFATTLLEPAEVGGVACEVVQFQYAETADAGVSRWWFGVEDHLPRRIQRVLTIPAGEATITYELSDLDTTPDIGDDAFAIAAPEGFSAEAYDTTGLLPVGSPAPGFTLKNDAGEDVALADLRGKVVVLDFWATWCGPCIAAMPGVQALHEEFKGQPVAIFGVNCWEQGTAEGAAAFFRTEQSLTYGLLLGGDAVADAYKVTGIPTFYVIGPDGSIVYRSVGAAGEDALRKIIKQTVEAN